MIAIKRLAAAAALFATLAGPAQAADPTERSEIESIVREYLLANPELLLEMQGALQAKQAQEAKERAQRTIAEQGELIFNSRHQAVVGNPEGDVTVVEFFDYNCSFCQRALEDMNALLETDDKLRFVMKELPILSQGSVEAARVSTAVYRLHPDRYAEFHTRLLSLEGLKDGERAVQVARDMGLDADALVAEGAKDDVLESFRETNALANALGVTGTPSYVIGREVVFGALGRQVLGEKVANMRECGATQCG